MNENKWEKRGVKLLFLSTLFALIQMQNINYHFTCDIESCGNSIERDCEFHCAKLNRNELFICLEFQLNHAAATATLVIRSKLLKVHLF